MFKYVPSLILSIIVMFIIWIVNNHKFEIIPIIGLLLTAICIGFFSYSFIAGYVEDKNIFVTCILSLVSIIIVYVLLCICVKCGCAPSDEGMERIEQNVERMEPKW